MRLMLEWLKSRDFNHLLEWRNWQTHGTQNPAPFTGHVGSTPTSSTINLNDLDVLPPFLPSGLPAHLSCDLSCAGYPPKPQRARSCAPGRASDHTAPRCYTDQTSSASSIRTPA